MDESGVEPGEVALYTLADPRDVRELRYVGQTRNPPSRFAQHINTARLWLPDERPWWIQREELRPLYEWIRALYADGERLPVMFIVGWSTAELALREERQLVRALVADGMPLLNRDAHKFGRRTARKIPPTQQD